jgi:hypothetical protein
MGIGYEDFASRYAEETGGQRLRDAMLRQLSGDDTDVAEVGWRVKAPSAENSAEIWANVQADWDRRRLTVSVDERASPDAEYQTVLSMLVYLGVEQRIVLGADVEPLTAEGLAGIVSAFRAATVPWPSQE